MRDGAQGDSANWFGVRIQRQPLKDGEQWRRRSVQYSAHRYLRRLQR